MIQTDLEQIVQRDFMIMCIQLLVSVRHFVLGFGPVVRKTNTVSAYQNTASRPPAVLSATPVAQVSGTVRRVDRWCERGTRR